MNRKGFLRFIASAVLATVLPLHAAPPVAKPTPTAVATPLPAQPSPTPEVLPKGVEKFTIKTTSATNPEVVFYLRVPTWYSRNTPNRLVFCCPDDGVSALGAGNGFNGIADDRGWFILSASFNPSTTPADSYYDPAGYSGKVLEDAMEQVAQKYPIARDALLLRGNGGGGQFVQRLALLHPEKVLAVAMHSANGFAVPDEKVAQFPWVVTSIATDANAADSDAFVAQLRRLGGKPIIRSYSEMARKVPGQVDSGETDTIACTAFAFYDGALWGKHGQTSANPSAAPVPATYAPAPFVGDLRSLRYYKEDAPEVAGIPEESRVDFPCEAMAKVWGAQIEKFLVKTASLLNPEIPYYVRVPANYSPTTRARVLFRCPVYNGIGVRCVSGYGAFQRLADERGWFMVSPTFKQEKEITKDRTKSYYYPETFSGRATLEALDLIAKKYPIATDNLLMQGMSGGAQFVHRFSIWAPERVTACAVNSSSWFDVPNEQSAQIAWLITIGESDKTYENSLNFFDQLRKIGALPIFRSYVGMVHEGSSKVDEFNLLFLKFYDDATRAKFDAQQASAVPAPHIPAKAMPLVGDMKDWTFTKNDMKAIMRIGEDNLVYLPTPEIARFWSGKGAEEDGGKQTGLNGAPY